MKLFQSTINIDLKALTLNFLEIKEYCQGLVCAVVKADAYGHGANQVSKKLASLGIKWFAVANLNEAITIRNLLGSNNNNILLLGNDFTNHLNIIKQYNITPTIYSLDCLKTLVNNINFEHKFHLEIDTGMHRTGILYSELLQAIDLIKQSIYIEVDGVFTHFSCADEPRDKTTQNQISLFNESLNLLAQKGIKPKFIHAENSAGILTAECEFNMVRPGLLLYGISPLYNDKKTNVQAIMSWYTHPLQIKVVKKGQAVSYSGTWVAKNETLIAIIPVGYADGYPRLVSNKGHVLINGCKASIVGNICMDFMMVDITHCGEVTLNSEVVLVGSMGDESVTMNDIALWSNTIAYEVLCSVGKRSYYQYIG